MSKDELTRIGCKLMAVYFFLMAASNIPTFAGFMLLQASGELSTLVKDGAWLFTGTQFIFVIAIPSIIGMFLWHKAGWLTKRILGDRGNDAAGLSITAEELKKISFSVVGVYVLAMTIPQLIRLVVAKNATVGYLYEDTTGNTKVDIITILVKIAIGTWLLLGSERIVSVIKRKHGNNA